MTTKDRRPPPITWRTIKVWRPRRRHQGLIAGSAIVTVLVAAIAVAGADRDSGTADATVPGGAYASAEADHSPKGAQRAAAAMVVALGSEAMYRPEDRHALLRRIGDPATLDQHQRDYDKDYSPAFNRKVGLDADGIAPAGSEFVTRMAPVGTSVPAYTEQQATVAVWSHALFKTVDETKPTADWYTVTVKLTWTSSGWRMLDSSQTDGPTPDEAAGRYGQAPPL
ncbi:hypothetical protein [Streptomyces sp. NPDC102437]|uniref:hypothetical protein n=1 Tax=Streptomyces sp. NPDC102437 TaxID=3366175 RepID=UPI0038148F3A